MPNTALLALFLPGTLRLGRLHLSVYALTAAFGLISALVLSQYTARLTQLSASALWDAGVFTLACGALVSRLTLVVFNFRQFFAYPLPLLSLPSFTGLDLLLTAGVALSYWRRHRLPVRAVIDAWAAPFCLLAAILQLAHLLEGTAAGMPATVPWAIRTSGDSILGPVHPVQIYSTAAFVALGCVLVRYLHRAPRPGRTAALAFTAGGLISFLLDMLRQPDDFIDTAWLDPSQFVAIVLMVAGVLLWHLPPARNATLSTGLAGLTTIAEDPH